MSLNLCDVIYEYERPPNKNWRQKSSEGTNPRFSPSIGFLRYIRIVNSDATSLEYLCSS